MKRKQILVEFAGISGVGKTTLANEVVSLLNQENIKYVDISSRGKKNRVTLGNIIPLLKVLYVTFILKPISLKGFIKLFKHIGAREIAILKGKNKHGFHVFDEGIFKISDFAVNEFSKIEEPIDFLDICFNYLRKPDILIVLEADPEVILNRRKQRNNAHENLDYKAILDRYNSHELDKALETYESEIKVIKLNHSGKKDLFKNSRKIIAELKAYS